MLQIDTASYFLFFLTTSNKNRCSCGNDCNMDIEYTWKSKKVDKSGGDTATSVGDLIMECLSLMSNVL